ncbi:MAG: TOBE domain-containing protein [Pseudomonadota bacterium]
MRTELKSLQRKLGITTLFVTHDQSEALAISDKVVVMFDGKIAQVATPDELYRKPSSLQVARFLAQPFLNEIDAQTLQGAIGTRTAEKEILIAGKPLTKVRGVVAIRPDHATLRRSNKPGLPGVAVKVTAVEHGGSDGHVFVESPDGHPLVVRLPSHELKSWNVDDDASFGFLLEEALLFPQAEAGASPIKDVKAA